VLAGIADDSQRAIHTAMRAARGDPPASIGGQILFAEVLGVGSGYPLQRNRRAGRVGGQGVLDGSVNRGMRSEVQLKLAHNADTCSCHGHNAATRIVNAARPSLT